jgi:hypothetical protein
VAETPEGEHCLPVLRFFTPGQLAPNQVDFLYSETVLLDLKLY